MKHAAGNEEARTQGCVNLWGSRLASDGAPPDAKPRRRGRVTLRRHTAHRPLRRDARAACAPLRHLPHVAHRDGVAPLRADDAARAPALPTHAPRIAARQPVHPRRPARAAAGAVRAVAGPEEVGGAGGAAREGGAAGGAVREVPGAARGAHAVDERGEFGGGGGGGSAVEDGEDYLGVEPRHAHAPAQAAFRRVGPAQARRPPPDQAHPPAHPPPPRALPPLPVPDCPPDHRLGVDPPAREPARRAGRRVLRDQPRAGILARGRGGGGRGAAARGGRGGGVVDGGEGEGEGVEEGGEGAVRLNPPGKRIGRNGGLGVLISANTTDGNQQPVEGRDGEPDCS